MRTRITKSLLSVLIVVSVLLSLGMASLADTIISKSGTVGANTKWWGYFEVTEDGEYSYSYDFDNEASFAILHGAYGVVQEWNKTGHNEGTVTLSAGVIYTVEVNAYNDIVNFSLSIDSNSSGGGSDSGSDSDTDTDSGSGSSSASLSPEQSRKLAVEQFVEELYINALGRTFDVTGRDAWVAQLMQGGSAAGVVNGFIGSQEFIGLNVDNASFVKILYRVFFDRTPAASEVANWVNAIESGATRTQVVNEFAKSPEWATRCAYYMINV